MNVAILCRTRFRDLNNATVKEMGGNAVEVHIPPSKTASLAIKPWTLDACDGLTMLIDDEESIQVLGTREEGEALVVTVLL